MIIYKTGNLLEAPVEALVNTVNTVGVMGKGVALQFKNAFPENTKLYLQSVKENKVTIGKMLISKASSINSVQYIINFPTKMHWRNPSKIEWIKTGLEDLRKTIIDYSIQSIALPPLGCGNGGLNWNEVKPLIESVLYDLDALVYVFEPTIEIQEILKKENKSSAAHLTKPRAMLLELLYRYRALGEFTSEFAAEKLSYFLQRFGEKQLRLNFKKGIYGPYSGKVRHVLFAINGYYLKGFEQKDAKPFEPLQLVIDKRTDVKEFLEASLEKDEKNRLELVGGFIKGYESPYGLELLATVDYLIQEQQSVNLSKIQKGLAEWSQRKNNLFPENHISIALEHLKNYAAHLYPSSISS